MSILVALVLSLLAPGSGQAYNGERRKAYVYAGIYLLVPLLAAPFMKTLQEMVKAETDSGWLSVGVGVGAAYAAVVLISMLDALFSAIKIRRNQLKTEGGGLKIGVLFAVCIYILRFGASIAAYRLQQ